MSDSKSSVILQCMSCLHVFGSALSLAEHKRQSQDCQTEEEAVLCGEAERVEWAEIKCEIKEEEEEGRSPTCSNCEKSQEKVPEKTAAQLEALQLLKADLPHLSREEREARVNDIVQSTGLTNDYVNEHFHLCSICGKSFKGKGPLKIHKKTHLPKDSEYEKPKRPCPYCGEHMSRLKRHILRIHAHEEDVIALKAANWAEKRVISSKLRKRGIFLENQQQKLTAKEPVLHAERPGKDKRQCPGCDGFYSRNSLYHHKMNCKGNTALDTSALKITLKYRNQLMAKRAASRSAKNSAANKHDSLQCPVCGRFFKRKGALTVHEKSHLPKEKYEKPKRPCPYCGEHMTRLMRHILRIHPHEEDVIAFKAANCSEKREISFKLRKRGINLEEKRRMENGMELKETDVQVCEWSFEKQELEIQQERKHRPKDSKYEKPRRPCPYCNKHPTKLMPHVLRIHSREEDVIAFQAANCDEKKVISSKLRKRGIFLEYQRRHLKVKEPVLHAERPGKDKRQCPGCDGFYSRSSFYRHKMNCKGNTSLDPSALKITLKYQNQLNAKRAASRWVNNRALCKEDPLQCSVCERFFKSKGALTVHEKSHLPKDSKYKRPKRPCPYCCKHVTKLILHLQRKHAFEEDVIALKAASSAKKKDIASKLRKRGILMENQRQSLKFKEAFHQAVEKANSPNGRSESEVEITKANDGGEEDGVDSLEEIPEGKRFQWSTADTDLVLKEFEEYVTGASEICLPGKQDLLRFRQRHQLKCTWVQIRSKIMNESSKARKKSQIKCPNSSEMAIGKKSEDEMPSEVPIADENTVKNRRERPIKVPTVSPSYIKWSAKDAELIIKEFDDFIMAPTGMRLPGKETGNYGLSREAPHELLMGADSYKSYERVVKSSEEVETAFNQAIKDKPHFLWF
ncbi:hypothetical protein CAPTEDRAFT_191311 [Capitella teleta]|uniref:C2H2-type domain-containing protein n=1 Tax=Capitella teleta TaxID=283909 RepID=R7U6A4_CAPTE|nr:hypothetical protein CAPTEDRAFT_191311 [Capitella teleta]|eukprot:ELU01885.1 hypothetical protein CAPTEDRAFT_191311 [Capitella teleta]